jgi:hypothetical protein
MRDRHAAPLGRFLGDLDDEQAERFIDHLATLIAHLRDEAVPAPKSSGGDSAHPRA